MLEPVLTAAWEGALVVFSWPNILYPVLGTLLAMMFALFPGVSGVTLMALAIPLTFDWDPIPIMLLFGAFVGGATFMGSVTSILFNIPGSAPNAATLIDGYPMAQQGRAKTALACAAAASALGSSFGVIVLLLLIPIVRPSLLAFGPPEFLMLAVWGLTTLAALRRGSLLKGLISAGLGLLLAFIGQDPRTAEARYTFGSLYLQDGLSLVPVFLGIFALAAVIELVTSERETISGETAAERLQGSVTEGIRAIFQNFGLFLRSSLLGTVLGMIPGVGATVASFLAYGHAVQTAKDPSRFGRGDIRGVLAPEAANDAKDGGALIPTLAFGIPGGTLTAMLLAVLALHGVTPGTELMSDGLSLVFVLVWSMFVSNWLTSILGLAAVRPLARLTVVRTDLLIPFILVLATSGTYVYRYRFGDVVAAYVFALVGYLMKRFGWPHIPLVVALVLGSLFERNLHITLRLHELERIDFWARPIVQLLLVLTVVSLGLPVVRTWRGKASMMQHSAGIAFTSSVLLMLAFLFVLTIRLGETSRLAPLLVLLPVLALVGAQLVLDRARLRRTPALQPAAVLAKPVDERAGRVVGSIAWILLLPFLAYLLGFSLGAPLFSFVYLRIRSRQTVWRSLVVAAAIWVLVDVGFAGALDARLYEGRLFTLR